jgi:hypothetical protein
MHVDTGFFAFHLAFIISFIRETGLITATATVFRLIFRLRLNFRLRLSFRFRLRLRFMLRLRFIGLGLDFMECFDFSIRWIFAISWYARIFAISRFGTYSCGRRLCALFVERVASSSIFWIYRIFRYFDISRFRLGHRFIEFAHFIEEIAMPSFLPFSLFSLMAYDLLYCRRVAELSEKVVKPNAFSHFFGFKKVKFIAKSGFCVDLIAFLYSCCRLLFDIMRDFVIEWRSCSR